MEKITNQDRIILTYESNQNQRYRNKNKAVNVIDYIKTNKHCNQKDSMKTMQNPI